jgi:myosin-5
VVRGALSRQQYKDLRQRHDASVVIQKHVRMHALRCSYLLTKKKVVLVQTVVRMWLAKRWLHCHRQEVEDELVAKGTASKADEDSISIVEVNRDKDTLEEPISVNSFSSVPAQLESLSSEVFTEPTIRVKPSYLLELQGRAVMAEKAVREKEEDNAMLRQRLQHYEARWLEYEAKTSSMEEMWQKQMTSLQLSLAAAKRSLAADAPLLHTPKNKSEALNVHNGAGRHPTCVSRHLLAHDEDGFDWDNKMTVSNKSPELISKCHHQGPECIYGAEVDAGCAVVGHLVREFDHRTQVFNDDADFLVEVKSGVTEASLNPEEELRKLKARFDTWKKDFKERMRDTRLVLQKLCNLEANERTKKKWWVKRTTP